MVTEYTYDDYGNCITESLSYDIDPEAWDYKDQVITYAYSPVVVTKEQKELAEQFYLPNTIYEVGETTLEFSYQDLGD